MHTAPFRYFRPGSINEAIQLMSRLGEEAKPLAGGQTLIPILKLRMDEPSALIDISRLPDLGDIYNDNGQIHIGALATHSQIGRTTCLSDIPFISDCANGIADTQVRNRGTIGGSISTADPSGDWASLLHILDANVVCHGPNGKRTLAIKDFIVDSYTTALETSELVTEVCFNTPAGRSGGSYIGFKKAAPSYPAAAVGIFITLEEEDICKDVRMVLSAVGPRPVVSNEAEAILRGKPLTKSNLTQAAEAIIAASDPLSDARGSAAFKRSMLFSLFKQATNIAINRAKGNLISGTHQYV